MSGWLYRNTVLRFAPRFALSQIRARRRAELLMNYDGASRGPRTKSFRQPATDADAASFGARKILRQRSRDLIRNRPFITRAQAVVSSNVVAKGIMPRIHIEGGNDAQQKKLSGLLTTHMLTAGIDAYGELALPSLQRVVMNGVFESGEVFVRRRMRDKTRSDIKLPFQIEVLEPDWLDDTRRSHGANQIEDGIEYDNAGRAVAYWIYPSHPGAIDSLARRDSERVNAADVLHIRRIDRPGQGRGVPWLAPVMLTANDLSDYQEAQIVKQKISALMAGVVETDSETNNIGASGKPDLDELAPGALVYAETGQKINWTTPPKVDGYDEFMRRGLSAMAMGLGITYESLSGDLSNVNFSSGRMGRMEMDRNVEVWQAQILIEQFCMGIERWMRDAVPIVSSDLAVLKWTIFWTPPRRALIDPTKEVPAMIKEMEAGLVSRRMLITERGRDPDEVDREIESDERHPSGATALKPKEGL